MKRINTHRIGYYITGRGGERGVFHSLMRNGHFLCATKRPKSNLVIAEASANSVECKKCLRKM